MKQLLETMLSHYNPILKSNSLMGFEHQPVGETNFFISHECAELICTGSDICSFLSRITTLAPERMTDRSHQLGFILEHNGKIKVSFDLYKVSHDRILLYCAPEEHPTLESTLDMFHFSEDVHFAKGQRTHTLCYIGKEALKNELLNDNVCLENWRGYRGINIVASSAEAFVHMLKTCLDSSLPIGDRNQFELLRFEHGIGTWLHEFISSVTPLDVRANAGIVEQKGCYPGQEVIERTLAIGRPAKKLLVLRGIDFEQTDEIKDTEGKTVGHVSSVLRVDDRQCVGLAILKQAVDLSSSYTCGNGPVSFSEPQGGGIG